MKQALDSRCLAAASHPTRTAANWPEDGPAAEAVVQDPVGGRPTTRTAFWAGQPACCRGFGRHADLRPAPPTALPRDARGGGARAEPAHSARCGNATGTLVLAQPLDQLPSNFFSATDRALNTTDEAARVNRGNVAFRRRSTATPRGATAAARAPAPPFGHTEKLARIRGTRGPSFHAPSAPRSARARSNHLRTHPRGSAASVHRKPSLKNAPWTPRSSDSRPPDEAANAAQRGREPEISLDSESASCKSSLQAGGARWRII